MAFFVIRALLGNKSPEGFGMVELLEVAEFVNDEIVLQGGFEEEDFVGKVEVAGGGTAAPTGFGVFDENFVVREVVVGVEMGQARVHQHARLFLVFLIKNGSDHCAL